MEIIPKIFEVAKSEPNAGLKALYEECITCTSEGNYMLYVIATMCMCALYSYIMHVDSYKIALYFRIYLFWPV